MCMDARPRKLSRVTHGMDLRSKKVRRPAETAHANVGRTGHFPSPISMSGVGSFSTGMRRPSVALEIATPRLVMAKSMVAMQRA